LPATPDNAPLRPGTGPAVQPGAQRASITLARPSLPAASASTAIATKVIGAADRLHARRGGDALIPADGRSEGGCCVGSGCRTRERSMACRLRASLIRPTRSPLSRPDITAECNGENDRHDEHPQHAYLSISGIVWIGKPLPFSSIPLPRKPTSQTAPLGSPARPLTSRCGVGVSSHRAPALSVTNESAPSSVANGKMSTPAVKTRPSEAAAIAVKLASPSCGGRTYDHRRPSQ